ncbi:hypothetical protein B0H11DRAFT_1756738, partial [Mycena galericulata]
MILAWRANIDIKPVMSKDAALNYIAKYATKAEQQAPGFPELLEGVVKQMGTGGTAQSACQKLLNKMLGERTYSAQETAHLLLGIPLVRTSVSFQTLFLDKEGSLRELEGDDGEENLEANDAETVNTGRRHMCDLSLQEVFQQYGWRQNEWRKRRKSTDTVVRTFPRYSPNPENELYDEYCRTKVILHHPFRDLASLRCPDDEEKSWPELFAECRAGGHTHSKDTLRSWEDENRSRQEEEDDDEETNPDVERMTEEDWQMFARDHPNAAIPRFDVSDLGTRPLDAAWDVNAARTRWNDVDQMGTYLDQQRRESGAIINAEPDPIDLATLANEQRAIFENYVSAYSKILAGEAIPQMLLNIDGTAGCGKTYLIHAICQELRRMAAEHGEPNPIRVLAPSGVAAFNIRGRTAHSALGLPV